jgi:hypothetical protein
MRRFGNAATLIVVPEETIGAIGQKSREDRVSTAADGADPFTANVVLATLAKFLTKRGLDDEIDQGRANTRTLASMEGCCESLQRRAGIVV